MGPKKVKNEVDVEVQQEVEMGLDVEVEVDTRQEVVMEIDVDEESTTMRTSVRRAREIDDEAHVSAMCGRR